MSFRALTMLESLELWQTEILILLDSIGGLKSFDWLRVSTLPDSIGCLNVF